MESEELDAAEVEERWPLWKKLLLGLWGLGLLASLVVPSSSRTVCAGRYKARADILAISKAIEQFAIEEVDYPTSLLPLVEPDENGFQIIPMNSVPRDPWGREYLYVPPASDTQDFDVRTLGSDGVLGGKGEAQDIDLRAIKDGKL